ncbi:anaerobic ribonucleoside-triphosphate reductase activating protein [Halomonas sp. CKK8]|uniref:anaerobic ribonucleoside-triphosphate reductase activating protein n=1 Tax=Halomonas sp. CKK8 TaxID=3036127 RepID=UPI00241518B9|nr:anaerobic ribonucleoside-triphosphate reductase activating protein [Halomonas sp. CKK8]WFM71240.1 anaerobic ribonucleoside-triphosphate reductase activating protein [Halomonas sp. CKK8]
MIGPLLRLEPAEAADLCLPVASLTASSTTDFPGRRAAVIHLQGCPLQCGYCEVSEMASPRRGEPGEWEAMRAFLEARPDGLDAVVFSGGEPTLHADLPRALAEAREMGLAVGLHTAGPYPERLAALLPRLDWVALDVKGRGRDFDRVCGRRGIWQQHARSLSLLLEGDTPFECRTTVHWRDFALEDLERLAMTLADCGVRHYVLQVARVERCRDPDYCLPVAGAPPREALEALVRRLAPHFERLTLRH